MPVLHTVYDLVFHQNSSASGKMARHHAVGGTPATCKEVPHLLLYKLFNALCFINRFVRKGWF